MSTLNKIEKRGEKVMSSKSDLTTVVAELKRSGCSDSDIITQLEREVAQLRSGAIRMLECFDQQTQFLEQVRYWEGTGYTRYEFFEELINPLRSKAEEKDNLVTPDHIPCVIVDGKLLSLYNQMELLKGENYLRCHELKLMPDMRVPNSPFYLAIDVEPHSKRFGYSCYRFSHADENLAKRGRQAMTIEAGIAVIRYDLTVLQRRDINCTGHKFVGRSGSPCLSRNLCGAPTLCWNKDRALGSLCNLPDEYYQVASCKEYVGI